MIESQHDAERRKAGPSDRLRCVSVHLPGTGHDGLHGSRCACRCSELVDRRLFQTLARSCKRRCGVLMVSQGAGLCCTLTQTRRRCRSFCWRCLRALGDIFDRRKLIVTTEVWMSPWDGDRGVDAAALDTPWMLLLLTVALSIEMHSKLRLARDPTRSCAPRRLPAPLR